MRPKKLKEKYHSEHKTPNLPKQKEKFLSEIRAKRQFNQALQPNLRAQINPTLGMMIIRHQKPKRTFQGLESDQERSLVGWLTA